jgi:hypothetical protein
MQSGLEGKKSSPQALTSSIHAIAMWLPAGAFTAGVYFSATGVSAGLTQTFVHNFIHYFLHTFFADV